MWTKKTYFNGNWFENRAIVNPKAKIAICTGWNDDGSEVVECLNKAGELLPILTDIQFDVFSTYVNPSIPAAQGVSKAKQILADYLRKIGITSDTVTAATAIFQAISDVTNVATYLIPYVPKVDFTPESLVEITMMINDFNQAYQAAMSRPQNINFENNYDYIFAHSLGSVKSFIVAETIFPRPASILMFGPAIAKQIHPLPSDNIDSVVSFYSRKDFATNCLQKMLNYEAIDELSELKEYLPNDRNIFMSSVDMTDNLSTAILFKASLQSNNDQLFVEIINSDASNRNDEQLYADYININHIIKVDDHTALKFLMMIKMINHCKLFNKNGGKHVPCF